jgi:hypothetical protein
MLVRLSLKSIPGTNTSLIIIVNYRQKSFITLAPGVVRRVSKEQERLKEV